MHIYFYSYGKSLIRWLLQDNKHLFKEKKIGTKANDSHCSEEDKSAPAVSRVHGFRAPPKLTREFSYIPVNKIEPRYNRNETSPS